MNTRNAPKVNSCQLLIINDYLIQDYRHMNSVGTKKRKMVILHWILCMD